MHPLNPGRNRTQTPTLQGQSEEPLPNPQAGHSRVPRVCARPPERTVASGGRGSWTRLGAAGRRAAGEAQLCLQVWTRDPRGPHRRTRGILGAQPTLAWASATLPDWGDVCGPRLRLPGGRVLVPKLSVDTIFPVTDTSFCPASLGPRVPCSSPTPNPISEHPGLPVGNLWARVLLMRWDHRGGSGA